MDFTRDILLVDVSHCVFHAYFEVHRWHTIWLRLRAGENVEPDVLPDTPHLVQRFCSALERCIADARTRTGNVPPCNVVLAKDCARDKVWRNALYDGYKKNRGQQRASRFNPAFFKHAYDSALPRLVQQGCQTAEVECAEADDVIALIHNEVRARNLFARIGVLTNDNDYVQLVDKNTLVFNARGVLLDARVQLEPEVYVETKILLGDKSDNIPPVLRRLSQRRAEALVRQPEQLRALLDADDSLRRCYELNRLLIDLRCIPPEVKARFEEVFKGVLRAVAAT